ncbi:unnamed protein product [Toxocara canis]|uniref:Uncharacterized protein n=1 Tax=Toxocara canis TaxID=6265 RepID=A0A183TVG4_TOXCA|nr:unnamed protein product [Toxocara canis]
MTGSQPLQKGNRMSDSEGPGIRGQDEKGYVSDKLSDVKKQPQALNGNRSVGADLHKDALTQKRETSPKYATAIPKAAALRVVYVMYALRRHTCCNGVCVPVAYVCSHRNMERKLQAARRSGCGDR